MILKLQPAVSQALPADGDQFQQVMHLTGPTFRAAKNRQTMRIILAGHAYFIKQHGSTSLREIIKNLLHLRLPVLGAKHEWLAIKKLSALGIPTTPLAGYGKRYLLPTKQESFLITSELTNQDSVENLCKTWRSTPPNFSYRNKIIQQIAHITRTMHQNGMNHRDLYLCHFLLNHKTKKTTRPYY